MAYSIYRHFLFATIFAVFSATLAEADKVDVDELMGDNKYCSAWNNNSNNLSQGAYMSGFVSGAAIFSGDNNLEDIPISEQVEFVDRYCAAHPESNFIAAVKTL